MSRIAGKNAVLFTGPADGIEPAEDVLSWACQRSDFAYVPGRSRMLGEAYFQVDLSGFTLSMNRVSERLKELTAQVAATQQSLDFSGFYDTGRAQ